MFEDEYKLSTHIVDDVYALAKGAANDNKSPYKSSFYKKKLFLVSVIIGVITTLCYEFFK